MNQYIFKPRARLLLQLGDQLIKNESVAILELLKNSYDADSEKVDVTMKNIENPSQGSIVIEDDGIGMNLDIVKNVWMEPGSDYKEKLFLEKVRTEKFERLPIGEKGIGRFGAHKLGYEIEIVSKKINNKEVYLKIDWNAFKKPRYLEDVPIEIYEREPKVFKGDQSGTKITIKNFRTIWSRGKVREVYRSMNSLCSPFNTKDSFHVNFEIDDDKKEWIKDISTWSTMKDRALFSVTCVFSGNKIDTFSYNFNPWDSMQKLSARSVNEADETVSKLKNLVKIISKKQVPLDLSKYKIGTVKLEMLIFDRDANLMKLGIQDKKGFKEYLDENGGMRVYRDGMRIFDYGEKENDWLNLDTRRINLPTKKISNNLIIGAIHLKREESQDLEEKTNREGFIENEAYQELRDAILWVLNVIETCRQNDKEKIRVLYGPTAKSEPVVAILGSIKDTVEKKVKDEDTKNKIISELVRVEAEYKNINETLLRSAGAGLNLSVVIHEVEKIVAELGKVVKIEKVSNRITNLIKRLSEMLDGYSDIIRSAGKKNESLISIAEQALFNNEFRLESHQVSIVKGYKTSEDFKVKCSKNLILGSMINIIDNAIWWLEYANVKNKKIFINIEQIDNEISLIIADNGPGFTLPTDIITRPFISGKPEGMGLGLHIASEVMQAQGGKILFPDYGDFPIPKEFADGAIIALCFNKGDKK